MKIFVLILILFAIPGCDRPDELGDRSRSHPANGDAPQSPPSAQSDTLKITYSKSDSYKPQTNPKPEPSDGKPDAHAGHKMEEKPATAPEKKPEHSEHQKK